MCVCVCAGGWGGGGGCACVCARACVCKLLPCKLEFVSMDFQKSEMTGTLAHMTLFLDKMSTFTPMHLLKCIQTY